MFSKRDGKEGYFNLNVEVFVINWADLFLGNPK